MITSFMSLKISLYTPFYFCLILHVCTTVPLPPSAPFYSYTSNCPTSSYYNTTLRCTITYYFILYDFTTASLTLQDPASTGLLHFFLCLHNFHFLPCSPYWTTIFLPPAVSLSSTAYCYTTKACSYSLSYTIFLVYSQYYITCWLSQCSVPAPLCPQVVSCSVGRHHPCICASLPVTCHRVTSCTLSHQGQPVRWDWQDKNMSP